MPRGPRENLVGRKFGRWTVLAFADFDGHEAFSKYAMWNCACGCGTQRRVLGRSLRFGCTNSCGCVSIRSRTHGMSDSCEHNAWCAMWRRVRGNDVRDRRWYVDRGIKCCARWLSFDKFYADMGPCPPDYTLDRKNNDKGYSSKNCRWATPKQQARNRTTSRIVMAFGMSMTLAEWAERSGVNYAVLWARLSTRLGWSVEKALTTGAKKEFTRWLLEEKT